VTRPRSSASIALTCAIAAATSWSCSSAAPVIGPPSAASSAAARYAVGGDRGAPCVGLQRGGGRGLPCGIGRGLGLLRGLRGRARIGVLTLQRRGEAGLGRQRLLGVAPRGGVAMRQHVL